MAASPVIREMRVIPVAGQDSMLLNLAGAHAPYFIRNVVVMKDDAGRTGIGEVPGGAGILRALENSVARVVGSEVLLHDEATHRVTENHRRCRQRAGDRADVGDVVGHRAAVQGLRQPAGAVTAQIQRQCAITVVSEEVQKVLVPAPGTVEGAVHEQQRHRMAVGGAAFRYDLQGLGHSQSRRLNMT